MRIAPKVTPTERQRNQLRSYSRGRSVAARLVERSRIILLAAEGKQDSEIAELLSIPRQKAARWRKRFLELGVVGLEKDAPRSGRPRKITAAKINEVVTKTTQTTPTNSTH